jgi:hypothetical protein
MTSQCRSRGLATLAMKNAIGSATSASRAVTAAATPMLRSATLRYTDSVAMVRKLSSVKVCTTSPVKLSTLQNAEVNSTASEPR